jgi:DinB family protein
MTAPAITSQNAAFRADQGLTVEELEQARILLQQAHKAVVGATKGLTEPQWTFKPAPDQWSIAENLDHIVTVQERVLGPVLDQLANAPAPPESLDRNTVDSIVIYQFSTRLSKFSAPEVVRPLNPMAPHELLVRLEANRAKLVARLESTPGLRQHVIPAPPLKAVSKGAFEVMDGYQWILAAAMHSERHVKQMLEVMANPDYPV